MSTENINEQKSNLNSNSDSDTLDITSLITGDSPLPDYSGEDSSYYMDEEEIPELEDVKSKVKKAKTAEIEYFNAIYDLSIAKIQVVATKLEILNKEKKLKKKKEQIATISEQLKTFVEELKMQSAESRTYSKKRLEHLNNKKQKLLEIKEKIEQLKQFLDASKEKEKESIQALELLRQNELDQQNLYKSCHKKVEDIIASMDIKSTMENEIDSVTTKYKILNAIPEKASISDLKSLVKDHYKAYKKANRGEDTDNQILACAYELALDEAKDALSRAELEEEQKKMRRKMPIWENVFATKNSAVFESYDGSDISSTITKVESQE